MRVRSLLTLTLALASGGCAMKGDVRDLQDEIRMLAARQDSLLAELRAQTLSTRDTVRTQSSQIFDFRGDISRRLTEIANRLQELQAIAGANQAAIASIAAQRSNGGAGAVGTRPPGPGGGGERLIGGGGAGTADDLYQTARDQYDRGSLNTALLAFQQFLDEYPDDDRAPTAQFLIASALSEQGQPEEALAAFQQIPALYPTAQTVPDALYRIAVLQVELGQVDDARTTLERIVNTYPGTMMATLARDKLAEIG
jgi:tol-pal system protein YbgF